MDDAVRRRPEGRLIGSRRVPAQCASSPGSGITSFLADASRPPAGGVPPDVGSRVDAARGGADLPSSVHDPSPASFGLARSSSAVARNELRLGWQDSAIQRSRDPGASAICSERASLVRCPGVGCAGSCPPRGLTRRPDRCPPLYRAGARSSALNRLRRSRPQGPPDPRPPPAPGADVWAVHRPPPKWPGSWPFSHSGGRDSVRGWAILRARVEREEWARSSEAFEQRGQSEVCTSRPGLLSVHRATTRPCTSSMSKANRPVGGRQASSRRRVTAWRRALPWRPSSSRPDSLCSGLDLHGRKRSIDPIAVLQRARTASWSDSDGA